MAIDLNCADSKCWPARLPLADADVRLIDNYLDASRATALLETLLRRVAWEQPVIRIFGKYRNSPRLHAWYGEPGARYRWSGREWQPLPWLPQLQQLLPGLEQITGARFNSCLANLYRDGHDAMGLHADDEPELGERPVIASLSLGVSRELHFRRRNDYSDVVPVALGHGALLIMSGTTQQHWKHEVRRRKRITAPRINLTFRHIQF